MTGSFRFPVLIFLAFAIGARRRPSAGLFQYAMVEDDVVVVDPVRMRVVDVIHGSAKGKRC